MMVDVYSLAKIASGDANVEARVAVAEPPPAALLLWAAFVANGAGPDTSKAEKMREILKNS